MFATVARVGKKWIDWIFPRKNITQENLGNSNFEGKLKTVWVSGGLSYQGQLNIQFAS